MDSCSSEFFEEKKDMASRIYCNLRCGNISNAFEFLISFKGKKKEKKKEKSKKSKI